MPAPFAPLPRLLAVCPFVPSTLGTPARAEPESTPTSRYLRIAFDDPDTGRVEGPCRVVEQSPEEAGYLKADCGVVGGIRTYFVTIDLREALTLKVGRREFALGLPGTVNGMFNTIGKDVEFRGIQRNGQFVPYALIVRVHGDSGMGETRELLAVAKVSSEGSCIIGTINARSEANANWKARALADRLAKQARCGGN